MQARLFREADRAHQSRFALHIGPHHARRPTQELSEVRVAAPASILKRTQLAVHATNAGARKNCSLKSKHSESKFATCENAHGPTDQLKRKTGDDGRVSRAPARVLNDADARAAVPPFSTVRRPRPWVFRFIPKTAQDQRTKRRHRLEVHARRAAP